jgi:hypothetical protein
MDASTHFEQNLVLRSLLSFLRVRFGRTTERLALPRPLELSRGWWTMLYLE